MRCSTANFTSPRFSNPSLLKTMWDHCHLANFSLANSWASSESIKLLNHAQCLPKGSRLLLCPSKFLLFRRTRPLKTTFNNVFLNESILYFPDLHAVWKAWRFRVCLHQLISKYEVPNIARKTSRAHCSIQQNLSSFSNTNNPTQSQFLNPFLIHLLLQTFHDRNYLRVHAYDQQEQR